MTANAAVSLQQERHGSMAQAGPAWVGRATLLWQHRQTLVRVIFISFAASLCIALLIPKQYKSVTRIMPPDQQSSGAMMLAALASRGGGLGALSGLAGGLLGGHTTTALFIDLLHSGTVSGRLVERFNLQKVYHSRYRSDAAKHLARQTAIVDDKKSGVITIEVQDTDPVRARDLAQGYLDELNRLVTRTSTSTARKERIFVEQRLHSVERDLERAQVELSDFSSKNDTIDLKEQTRAMVDAGARVQAELLVEQSGLESLRQLYGDGNVRVRETRARIASLQGDLKKMAGNSAEIAVDRETGENGGAKDRSEELYPPLRQLPRLAVPYADLYRRVRVRETVFELLTQQYEMARIEEAKDVPVVSVIDSPSVPEKKSFPPRLVITVFLTMLCFAGAGALILMKDRWQRVQDDDARKMLASDVLVVLKEKSRSFRKTRGAA